MIWTLILGYLGIGIFIVYYPVSQDPKFFSLGSRNPAYYMLLASVWVVLWPYIVFCIIRKNHGK